MPKFKIPIRGCAQPRRAGNTRQGRLRTAALLAAAWLAPLLLASAAHAQGNSNRPYVLDQQRQAARNAAPATRTTPAADPQRGTAAPGIQQPKERPAATRFASQEPAPIPLLPPDDPELSQPPAPSPAGTIWTVISSLAVVLGLFFAVAYMNRKAGVGGPAMLPTEAFEVLGRAPLTGRQHAQVVRFGDKLILLSVSPTGVDSLAEVTSEEEVERIAALCQQQRSDSVTQTFRQVLTQFSREPAPAGFVGDEAAEAAEEDRPVSEFERLA